jgi:hypothetical protein
VSGKEYADGFVHCYSSFEDVRFEFNQTEEAEGRVVMRRCEFEAFNGYNFGPVTLCVYPQVVQFQEYKGYESQRRVHGVGIVHPTAVQIPAYRRATSTEIDRQF